MLEKVYFNVSQKFQNVISNKSADFIPALARHKGTKKIIKVTKKKRYSSNCCFLH